MARLSARGLLVALAVLAVVATAQLPHPAVAPIRVPPTRPAAPALWPTTRIRNLDYVSLRDVATRFNLKIAWSKAETDMTLSDAQGVRFNFESNQKDFYFDRLRIFLGVPVMLHKDSLWVSTLDLIKIVAPLFRPIDHRAFLPATEPKVIVIDPGHGGVDPGTQNVKLGLSEKFATLDIALRLAKLLEARGWRVLLVREKDTELSKDKKADLLMRDEFANRNKADLYLSIHFNNAGPAVAGIETYAFAPQFMLSAGREEGDDMTKVSYPGNKLDYANLLFGEQLHRAMTAGLKTPDRGFKHARHAVLRMLDCPGALVECAYLSNDAEARRVARPEFRQQIAESLANGVQGYAVTLASLQAPVAAPPPPAPAPVLVPAK